MQKKLSYYKMYSNNISMSTNSVGAIYSNSLKYSTIIIKTRNYFTVDIKNNLILTVRIICLCHESGRYVKKTICNKFKILSNHHTPYT